MSRRKRWHLRGQDSKLADRPTNERALEAIRRDLPDMQTPEFWRRVWSEETP
jgi:hypothetical protein